MRNLTDGKVLPVCQEIMVAYLVAAQLLENWMTSIQQVEKTIAEPDEQAQPLIAGKMK